MSKNLIGNSLSYVMREILSGEISVDDIGKIYAGTCFTEETMSKLISEYNFYWEEAARNRAEAEICQKYGIEDIWDLEDKEKRKEAHQEVFARAGELLPEVTAEAEEILHNFWDNNKIIQTRYRIPEGQSVMAKYTPANIRFSQGKEEYETQGSSRGEVIQINGEFYEDWYNAAGLGIGSSNLFNNELELIANQLRNGLGISDDSYRKDTRIFFMQKMFPQYKDAIAQVSEKLDWSLSEDDILNLLNEALRQTGEHTAEEIGDGVKDLTQGELGEALTAITDIGEPQKDPHSLE